MARYLSCPAVSQIWALIVLLSTGILLVANSTPIVDLDSRLNSFLVNRESKLPVKKRKKKVRSSLEKNRRGSLFPTPESPISTTVKKGKH